MTRWIMAVVLGTVVSWPLAWLLSHAALLPFFLGLFFFALFGLLIGAIMHRVASPARPLPRNILLIGTTWIVLFVSVLSVYQESRDMPRKLADVASKRTRDIGDRPTADYLREIEGNIHEAMRSKYGSAGMIAYVRWVMSSGKFPSGEVEGVASELRGNLSGVWWMIRVGLSVGLLAFGVSSQTLALRWQTDPGVRQKKPAASGAAVPESAG